MSDIVIFNGSPRKHGATSQVIDFMTEKLTKNGLTIKIYYLNDKNIRGCQGCMYCKKNQTFCIQEDTLQKMYQDIADANVIIVGSPIYMFDISAQTKTWMDRLYPFIDRDHHPLYPNKNIVTIYSQGGPSPIAFEPQMERINKVFSMFGWKEIGRLNLTGKSPHVVPAELTDNEMEKALKIIDHLIG